MTIGLVVLAGGKSGRMGTDKSRVCIGGRRLLDRVLDVALPLVDGDVLVIGPWAPAGVPAALELPRHLGPLNALAFGLSAISDSHALVLGCDHPLLEPAVLELLIRRRYESDCVVPVTDSGPEPLVAVYSASLSALAVRLVAAGERRLRALFDVCRVTKIPSSQWCRLDPNGRTFLDVDRQDDIIRAERLLRPTPRRAALRP